MDRTILITGASSGIGEALALHYAAPGVTLALSGRNRERLDGVAVRCEEKGAEVVRAIVDVTDKEVMQAWIEDVQKRTSIDLVIANAGISAGSGSGPDGEGIEQARRIFDTNLMGVLNTIGPVLPEMLERGEGQIALISSLAGYRGWPGAPAYCGSKAAVKIYGESLRGALAGKGIKVNVILPGFIISRMTDQNDFCMPFLMDTDKGARIIAKGIEKNAGRVSFPFPTAIFAWFLSILPDSAVQSILKKTPPKV